MVCHVLEPDIFNTYVSSFFCPQNSKFTSNSSLLELFTYLHLYIHSRRQLGVKDRSLVFACCHAYHLACLDRVGGLRLSETGDEVWTCLACHQGPVLLGSLAPSSSTHQVEAPG